MTLDEVCKFLARQRLIHPDVIVGYTSGVFDLFHVGHEHYIASCKDTCDILLVGVDSDERVTRRKGKTRPLQSHHARVSRLHEEGCVSFLKTTPSETYIRMFQPDLLYFPSNKTDDECSSSTAYKFSDSIKSHKISYTVGVSTTLLMMSALNS